ncbi:12817_t:CDS:2 [Funneliformis mosseae]|uniref:12817_t:CDS:1 n=1 Tax=Funneliformis mosseae TaxID=27381 RepID=A0A9N8W2G5_FUNMO|nr:12817_t:CDS:2 [Funneliformis mosseae]
MYIRFLEISSKDFHSIIWPFKKVLPQALFEDIVSFHMSNTEPKQNKLIPRKPKHAAIIVNWIQRKDSNAGILTDCKYNLNLIYRRSRDGYGLYNIRRICDRQGACILIIKTKENETIIGGYNPIGDGKDLSSIIISRVTNSNNAIYESSFIPLNFGNSDLVIKNDFGTCNQAQYESNILDNDNFTIEEMEIFSFNKS